MALNWCRTQTPNPLTKLKNDGTKSNDNRVNATIFVRQETVVAESKRDHVTCERSRCGQRTEGQVEDGEQPTERKRVREAPK